MAHVLDNKMSLSQMIYVAIYISYNIAIATIFAPAKQLI